jgi:uncharacterized protein YuzE
MKPEYKIHENTMYSYCACHTEMLAMELDEDKEFLEIAFFQMGKYTNMTFIQKLRHIWQVIRYGSPYKDMVCFDKETSKQFSNNLKSMIKEMEPGEDVEIDIEDDKLLLLMTMAHEQDITLNELVNNILRKQIALEEAKEQPTATP